MRYLKKKYETPVRPWDRQRIEEERATLAQYGLKNKKELWRAQGDLRKFRRLARLLAARSNKEQESLIVEKLVRLGILDQGSGLDDILALTPQKFLDRRLQTVIQKKGIANTVKHARQMIVHGHVRVGERKVVYPSYLVSRAEESQISKVAARAKTVKVEKNAEEASQE